jgi:hypothetical protein
VIPDLCEDRFISSHHPYFASRPLSGIISFLTHKHGGNVHDRGIIKLSSSSQTSSADAHPLKDIVDLYIPSRFWTENLPNQWICFDFKTYRVIPTHYSVVPESGASNLRNWVLEGWNDNQSWVTLDTRNNDDALRLKPSSATFKLGSDEIGEFRMIRIRQTGKTHGNDDYLCVAAFEIFGELKGSDP